MGTLLDLLDARHKLTRRRVARILSEVHPAVVHPLLGEALADTRRPARSRAAAARVLTATSDGEQPLLSAGLQACEVQVRRAAATQAAPAAALVGALADPAPEVVQKAAEALATKGHRPDLATLTAAAERHGATGALARLIAQADPASPALVQAARDGDPAALDHLSDPAALASLLDSPHAAAAAWALARQGHLARLVDHPDPNVRAAAARQLPRGSRHFADDPDPGVRWLAQQAALGAYRHPETRLGPHARSGAASAQAPYGLRPGDTVPSVERAPAALALCQTSFDVNLGVAVRSAEAAGLREVFVVGHRALFKSPARGTEQVIPVTPLADPAALVRLAREGGYQIVGVQQTPRSVAFHTAPYPPRPLFVLGAEGEGLPDPLRLAADLLVEIPLFGVIDSLNVAAAATTVLFHWRVHAPG